MGSKVSMVSLGMCHVIFANIYGRTNLNITISLGPADLTLGTLSPATTSTVPTIVDNAFSQGLISADEISIAFEPTTSAESLNGVLTWGISVLLMNNLVIY